MSTPPRQLTDAQVKTFDVDYMSEERWKPVRECLQADFPDGAFSFLDLGGGNGLFADKVLGEFPKSRGTVVELSGEMVRKNTTHPRKTVSQSDVVGFVESRQEPVDVIFCNWILHHLVGSDYRASIATIRRVLAASRSLLSDHGRISIYENAYNGYVPGAPGRIIYALTSSSWMAPIIRRLGANTAGTGVCFLSHSQWLSVLQAGFVLRRYSPDAPWILPISRRVPLLLRTIQGGHYWLERRPSA